MTNLRKLEIALEMIHDAIKDNPPANAYYHMVGTEEKLKQTIEQYKNSLPLTSTEGQKFNLQKRISRKEQEVEKFKGTPKELILLSEINILKDQLEGLK